MREEINEIVNFLKKRLKKVFIKIIAVALVVITIAACFLTVVNTIKNKMVDMFINIGTSTKGAMSKLWQKFTRFLGIESGEIPYYVNLSEKTKFILDPKTGDTLAYIDEENRAILADRTKLIELARIKYPGVSVSSLTDDQISEITEEYLTEIFKESSQTREKCTKEYTLVDHYVKELGNQGISIRDLRLLGNADYTNMDELLSDGEKNQDGVTNKELVEKYIAEFIRADIITQQPHRTNSDTNVEESNQDLVDGGIYFWRTENEKIISDDEIEDIEKTLKQNPDVIYNTKELDQDEKYKQMAYMLPEDFEEAFNAIKGTTTNEKLVEELKYRFTQDPITEEIITIKVKQMQKIVETTFENPRENIAEDLKKAGVETTYQVEEYRFSYKEDVAKYAMPYEFLINLCQVTQNPEFAYHVALLARDTKIILAIRDNATTVQRETTDVYTQNIHYVNGTEEVVGAQEEIRESKERTIRYTITQTPELRKRFANTWNFYEEYEYSKNIEGTLNEPDSVVIKNIPSKLSPVREWLLNDANDPNSGTYERIKDYEADGSIVETWEQDLTITVTYDEPVQVAGRNGQREENGEPVEKSKQFLGLLRNDEGKCKHDNCYQSNIKKNQNPIALECAQEAVFNEHGTNVLYKIPNMTRVEPALNKLQSGEKILYSILQSSAKNYRPSEETRVISAKQAEDEEDYQDLYAMRMEAVVEHLRYLMEFPENENVVIKNPRPGGHADTYISYSPVENETQEITNSLIGWHWTCLHENSALWFYKHRAGQQYNSYLKQYVTQDGNSYYMYKEESLNDTMNYGFGVCIYHNGNYYQKTFPQYGINVASPQYHNKGISTMPANIVDNVSSDHWEGNRQSVISIIRANGYSEADFKSYQIDCMTDMYYQGYGGFIGRIVKIYMEKGICEELKSLSPFSNCMPKWRGTDRWTLFTEGRYVLNGQEVPELKNVRSSSGNLGSVSKDGGKVYYQDDYSGVSYGSSTLAKCGCGPTCFAMVASDLGVNITPEDAVAWCGNRYYVYGKGTSWAYFNAAATHFGLGGRVVDLGNNIDSAVAELQKGNLVISSQNPGMFTSSGHFIVLSSINENGGITVRDPNKNNAVNKNYENRAFSSSEISASGANYWVFKR